MNVATFLLERVWQVHFLIEKISGGTSMRRSSLTLTWHESREPALASLREMYPAFDRFQAVRRELDPQGRMLNQHLQTLFGATG